MSTIFLEVFCTFKNLMSWLHTLLRLLFFAHRALSSHCVTQRFYDQIVPRISVAKFLFQSKICAN